MLKGYRLLKNNKCIGFITCAMASYEEILSYAIMIHGADKIELIKKG